MQSVSSPVSWVHLSQHKQSVRMLLPLKRSGAVVICRGD